MQKPQAVQVLLLKGGPADVRQESLKCAEKTGAVGPQSIEGWQLDNVGKLGNCFYEAIILQMENLTHPFLAEIPDGTLPRDSLRLRIQGDEFKDEEWAGDKQIDKFVREFNVLLAIVDTRTPVNGFVAYYLNEDGSVKTHVPDDVSPLPDKSIIRIAATGTHFLSVKIHPALLNGCLRGEFQGGK
jgi:hypothetical protein